jgi:phosphomannomutase
MPKNTHAEALVMDIDGTLTPPREQLKKEMADALSKLRVPFFVAAGSDLPLVKDQFFDPLQKFHYRGSIEAFLSNGASHYRCNYSQGYSITVVKEFNIEKHLGVRRYKTFLSVLKDTLNEKRFRLPRSIKVSGKRIIERGPMVNLAPIGRPHYANLTNADLKNRKKFVDFDRAHHYRSSIIAHLETELEDIVKEKNLKILYGGQTSFDIIIKGMDKTHPLNILLQRGFKRIIFIGDALFEGGNDSVIMEFIKEWNGPRPCPVVAIKVDDWQNTIYQLNANNWLEI